MHNEQYYERNTHLLEQTYPSSFPLVISNGPTKRTEPTVESAGRKSYPV